jgi:hypothetical protein
MATKEEVYDSQINPLMAQIIAICKEHKIAHVCSFSLGLDGDGDELLCTSMNLSDDFDPPVNLHLALAEIYKSRQTVMAITITNKPDK